MTITSFSFLILVALGVIIYYVVPRRFQWLVLLTLSIVFYYKAGIPYTIIYLVISTAIAYASTMFIEYKQNRNESSKVTFVVTICAILLNIAFWFLLKGKGLWAPVIQRLTNYIAIPYADKMLGVQLVAALGMGYYTLQVLGYIIDCYWGTIKPQKNPVKLFLFVGYFPQLMTGPISRYSQLETLYSKHKFSYHNIAFGVQRILWGILKKLVLAERVGIIVSAITSAPDTYTGFYSWIAILLYPVQMYADFSGCMDIVLGVSELFGIRLAENFNNPFFSRTSQEFWQRWHITLGTWAKDYVLYPLLKSKPMLKLGKFTKGKFGKKQSKFIVNLVGMFFLWMVMGIWHGGLRYIVGVSLWYWVVLMLGELFSSIFAKTTKQLNMKTNSFAWHLFQSVRTYCIYAIGATFFSLGVTQGIGILKDALKVVSVKDYANPWVFFDSSILETGVTYGDINIIIISVALLFVVGVLREKYGYARNWVEQQSVGLRWIIWIFLFVFVLIWGKYGPGYDAAEFIYRGF